MSTAMTRRLKWHPSPTPPSPRILNLPRRHRRRLPKPPAAPDFLLRRSSPRDKLETLFHQERAFSKTVPIVVVDSGCERRERVEEEEAEAIVTAGDAEAEEERWRVEAEILRAECNFLRMEREVAVKKLEKTRVRMETALRSAVQTLISGKQKICEGKSVNRVLEEEIEDLAEKLEKLQRSTGVKDLEVKKCSNFDKQTCVLQKRLEKLGGISDRCVKEIQQIAEASFSINTSCIVGRSSISNHRCNKFMDVEILRSKMEGLSRGFLLERMKEYGSLLSAENSSIASSASTSMRIEASNPSSPVLKPLQETVSHEEHGCSGRCKVVVQRIMEQVRTETEQWSQMQKMLEQVREEMEELNASRDFWEYRALDSEYLIQYLRYDVEEWKQKAVSSNDKANELQAQVFILREEINNLRKEQNKDTRATTTYNPMHNETAEGAMTKKKEALSEGRRKTYTPSAALLPPRRLPFREIGNLAPMLRQNSKKATSKTRSHPKMRN